MSAARKKIAIVGAGISGITAAYHLDNQHEVTLIEASDRIGGHAHPVRIEDESGIFHLDTAFLIFNNASYPNFLAFLTELGLSDAVIKADMSIGVHDQESGLLYAVNAGLPALFQQKRNLFRPAFLRLIGEIRRFRAGGDGEAAAQSTLSLGAFLQTRGYSEDFRDFFAYPLGAAVWSLPRQRMEEFSASLFFHFFTHHKILKHRLGASWQTMRGSSQLYLERFREKFRGKIALKRGVAAILREAKGCVLVDCNGEREAFDHIVLALHADAALNLLPEPTTKEQRLLSAWSYQDCSASLHTDTSHFPQINQSWGSWNIQSKKEKNGQKHFSITYYLNRIQKLTSQRPYFLTINGQENPASVIQRFRYRHPVFSTAALASQKELPSLNSEQISFCGSYFGHGFHEDAIASALLTVDRLGDRRFYA